MNLIYDLCHYEKQNFKAEYTSIKEFMKNPEGKRLMLHPKGSYLAFEERQSSVSKIIEEFLVAVADGNNLVDWIFNEKMLGIIEHDITSEQIKNPTYWASSKVLHNDRQTSQLSEILCSYYEE